jgi:hypothetical protein
MLKTIYVPELPENVIIKTETLILVGTKPKGDVLNERLCSQEREQVELHC